MNKPIRFLKINASFGASFCISGISGISCIGVAAIIATASISRAEAPAVSSRQSGKVVGAGIEPLKFELTSPKGGWTVDRMVEVAGRVNDTTLNPITVNINGARYLLRINGDGTFKRKFPVTSGKNSVAVSGSNAHGFAEEKRTFYARVEPVALMAILTSDTDGVYTDLHIYEPNANIAEQTGTSKSDFVHVFWANTRSPSGGSFYLNEQNGDYDQPGYGPYLYTHRAPPVGIFRIDTNYWPSGDKAHTVASLDLVLYGGTPNEVRRKIQTPLAMSGETSTLAWIKVEKGQHASVYSPISDPLPKKGTWPDWVISAKPRRTGTPED